MKNIEIIAPTHAAMKAAFEAGKDVYFRASRAGHIIEGSGWSKVTEYHVAGGVEWITCEEGSEDHPLTASSMLGAK